MPIKSFEPNRDVPVVDKRGEANPQWWAFWNRLASNSNDSTDGNEELFNAIYQWLGPAISSNNAQIFEILKRLNQEIQFKDVDYELLLNDSGVILDTDAGDIIATMPDAALWKNEDKFVENAGDNVVSIELFEDQQVSGVDVLLLYPSALNPVANMKSTREGLTLLSDRNGSDVVGTDLWITKFGEQMTTKFGEKLVFKV